MILSLAVAAAEHVAEEAPSTWAQVWEMVTSPADYLGHFVIEGVFTIVGVHAIHKIAHSTVHGAARRALRITRFVRRGGAT